MGPTVATGSGGSEPAHADLGVDSGRRIPRQRCYDVLNLPIPVMAVKLVPTVIPFRGFACCSSRRVAACSSSSRRCSFYGHSVRSQDETLNFAKKIRTNLSPTSFAITSETFRVSCSAGPSNPSGIALTRMYAEKSNIKGAHLEGMMLRLFW